MSVYGCSLKDSERKACRAFADGAKKARSGFMFSNDDHSRWDYVDYYLVDRDEAEKNKGM